MIWSYGKTDYEICQYLNDGNCWTVQKIETTDLAKVKTRQEAVELIEKLQRADSAERAEKMKGEKP